MDSTKRQPHFVQTAGQPVFTGQGTGELACRCGESVLVRGYDPRNFLAADFQCGSCGAITTTPGLSALNNPPSTIVQLNRIGEIAPEGATIPPGAVLAGREEIDRLMALYQPRSPASDSMTITADLLDSVAADYDRLTGGALAAHMAEVVAADGRDWSAMRTRPLAWAIRTLRGFIGDPDWECGATDSSSVATAVLGAFQHFQECWSHHPLFPMMAAAAGDTGFSLHGAARFATAKCLSDSGNHVAYSIPRDGSGRVRDFTIATGPMEHIVCEFDVFDHYEWPLGKIPDFLTLRAAVRERLLASKARINPKRPGMIVLSPGAIHGSMDQMLADAIIATLQSQGRRYPAVSAISVILARIFPTASNTVRFGYTFYPMANPRHTGGAAVQIGPRPAPAG